MQSTFAFTGQPACLLHLKSAVQWKWWGFPGGSGGKESACSVGELGPIPGLGRSPGEGKGHPLQYSGLENPQGQRSLAGYSPWGRRVRHDWANKHKQWKWWGFLQLQTTYSCAVKGLSHSSLHIGCMNLQFSSVAQSCPTLCDPMDCSTPGLPVHHQLPEFTHFSTKKNQELALWKLPILLYKGLTYFHATTAECSKTRHVASPSADLPS